MIEGARGIVGNRAPILSLSGEVWTDELSKTFETPPNGIGETPPRADEEVPPRIIAGDLFGVADSELDLGAVDEEDGWPCDVRRLILSFRGEVHGTKAAGSKAAVGQVKGEIGEELGAKGLDAKAADPEAVDAEGDNRLDWILRGLIEVRLALERLLVWARGETRGIVFDLGVEMVFA